MDIKSKLKRDVEAKVKLTMEEDIFIILDRFCWRKVSITECLELIMKRIS